MKPPYGGDKMKETETDNSVIIVDDEGNEEKFSIVNAVELDGERYVLLVSEEEQDDAAMVFRVDEEDDEEVLSVIEDDDEFNKVVSAFAEIGSEDEESEFELYLEDEEE